MSSEELPPPTEIVEGIYDISIRLRDRGKRNRVYLDVEGVPTLFDAGYDFTTDVVADGIEAVGTDPERLVITHGDGDHVGGFGGLAEAYDLETWVPEQTTAELETEPTHRYGDGAEIGPWEAVHAPGHEPDNHCLVDEERGVLITGDAMSGADRRGLPAGYLTLPPSSADLNQALSSLERLVDYDFDVALVYHGTAVLEDAHEKLHRYVNPI